MSILVSSSKHPSKTVLEFSSLKVPCSIGHGGFSDDKQEGDGTTPIGIWPLRRVFYRSDKNQKITTALPKIEITREMGWCDDPLDHQNYNRLIKTPHKYRHEELWRCDNVYDIIVELGYNDSPPILGRGSAVFLHVADEGFAPTAGCIAIEKLHILTLLSRISPGEILEILG